MRRLHGAPGRHADPLLQHARFGRCREKIVTIEGVDRARIGKVVQEAWKKLDVVQCGYCQSGQIMSAVALLEGNRKPSNADIDAAMAGNICRCATYVRIRAAIHEAAQELA